MNRQKMLLGVDMSAVRSYRCAKCGARCWPVWAADWREAQRQLSEIRRGVAVCSDCKPVPVDRVDFGLFASVA